jgi:cytochrome P450
LSPILFTDRDILITAYTLYFTGVPTIYEIYWYILYLMHNPDVTVRMRNEIEENVGMNKSVTMTDQAKLPYCSAVMYEAMRASSTTPVTPPHIFAEDIEVKGYTLPKDALLIPALCTINMDPTIFPEPEKFKPKRFLNDDGELAGYEKVYTSFSLGLCDLISNKCICHLCIHLNMISLKHYM